MINLINDLLKRAGCDLLIENPTYKDINPDPKESDGVGYNKHKMFPFKNAANNVIDDVQNKKNDLAYETTITFIDNGNIYNVALIIGISDSHAKKLQKRKDANGYGIKHTMKHENNNDYKNYLDSTSIPEEAKVIIYNANFEKETLSIRKILELLPHAIEKGKRYKTLKRNRKDAITFLYNNIVFVIALKNNSKNGLTYLHTMYPASEEKKKALEKELSDYIKETGINPNKNIKTEQLNDMTNFEGVYKDTLKNIYNI